MNKHHETLHPHGSIDGGLVRLDPELGRILAEKDSITFRAQGTCMYPCMRPGDILRIEPCPMDEAMEGDIVVCRQSGILYAHRLIRKETDENGTVHIVTKPDRESDGEDLPTKPDDFIGVVKWMERDGKRVSTEKRTYSFPARIGFSILSLFYEPPESVRSIPVKIFRWFQDLPGYSKISGLVFTGAGTTISHEIRIPVGNGRQQGLYRKTDPETFNMNGSGLDGKPIKSFRLTAVVNGMARPAAEAVFIKKTAGSEPPKWYLEQVDTRLRFRKTGVIDALLLKADEIFQRNGESFFK